MWVPVIKLRTSGLVASDFPLSHLSGPFKIDLFLLFYFVYVWCMHGCAGILACVDTGRQTLTSGVFLNYTPLYFTFKIYFLLYVCLCLNICLCDKCLQSPQKDVGSSGTRITGGHELPFGVAGNPTQDLCKNSNSLTTEPYL